VALFASIQVSLIDLDGLIEVIQHGDPLKADCLGYCIAGLSVFHDVRQFVHPGVGLGFNLDDGFGFLAVSESHPAASYGKIMPRY
jgi:hypothetical protein